MLKTESEKNWYMRLTAKFFDSNEIKAIKSLPMANLEPNFPQFIICLYLEMLCYSIPNNGLIFFHNFECGVDDISYAVARMFNNNNMPPVHKALAILEKYGLIEFGETTEGDRTIFMPDVPNNTGSSKLSSEQRQRRRLAAKRGEALLLSTENGNEKICYGKLFRNVFLSESEYERLKTLAPTSCDEVIDNYSLKKKADEAFQIETRKMSDFEALMHLIDEEIKEVGK